MLGVAQIGRYLAPHKSQWRRTLMFSLICAWTNGWTNNRDVGDLRRLRTHHDVIVMIGHHWLHSTANSIYHKTSNISHTLAANNIVDHSEVWRCISWQQVPCCHMGIRSSTTAILACVIKFPAQHEYCILASQRSRVWRSITWRVFVKPDAYHHSHYNYVIYQSHYPTIHLSHIQQYSSLEQKCAHFFLQSGVLWGMGQAHCRIGLLQALRLSLVIWYLYQWQWKTSPDVAKASSLVR